MSPANHRTTGATAPPYGDLARLTRELSANLELIEQSVRLGSLRFRLRTSNPTHVGMLEELLRIDASIRDPTASEPPLTVVDVPREMLHSLVPVPESPVVEYPDRRIVEVHRDVAVAVSESSDPLDREPSHGLTVALQRECRDPAHLLHCFMVVLYRSLFAWHRLPLHAAAVDIPDIGTCLFVGDKGAGKSTLSVHFAREGGTVLGEDHVLLCRRTSAATAASGQARSVDRSRFTVSGCDGRSRLTLASERHFFPAGLPVDPIDVAGVQKKEFELSRYVASAPYEDREVRAIFFPQVVADLPSLRSVPAAMTVLRLLGLNRERQRFAGATDRQSMLDYFADLARLPTFDLALSPDLGDLDAVGPLIVAALRP